MKYRVEHDLRNGTQEALDYGSISPEAAQARARRLSLKDGSLGSGTGGHFVYLYGYDEDGTDQEAYTFYGGSLVEKDLVKDWDKE